MARQGEIPKSGGSFPWATISLEDLSERSDQDIQLEFGEWDQKTRDMVGTDDLKGIVTVISNRALCSHVLLKRCLKKLELAEQEVSALKVAVQKCEENNDVLRQQLKETDLEKDDFRCRNWELVEKCDDLSKCLDRFRGENERLLDQVSESEYRQAELEEKERELRDLAQDLKSVETELAMIKKERRLIQGNESNASLHRDNELRRSTSRVSAFPPSPVREIGAARGEMSRGISTTDLMSLLRESEERILGRVSNMIIRQDASRVSVSQAEMNRPRHDVQHRQDEDWLKFCRNITRFNPESSKEAIDEFIAGIKNRVNTRNPPFSNEAKVGILRISLEGSAQVALAKYPHEVQENFEMLRDRLLRDFGRFPCEDAALAALRGKEGKQMINERPGEFVRRLERLCSQAYGRTFRGREDIQLRVAFSEGLLPHIRDKVEALALTDLDEMVAKAEVFFHKVKAGKTVGIRENIQVFSVTEGGNDRLELEFQEGEDAQVPVTKTQSVNGKTRVFKGNCYGCKKPGHRLRDCRAAKQQQGPQQDQAFSSFLQSMKAFFEQQISKEPQVGNA